MIQVVVVLPANWLQITLVMQTAIALVIRNLNLMVNFPGRSAVFANNAFTVRPSHGLHLRISPEVIIQEVFVTVARMILWPSLWQDTPTIPAKTIRIIFTEHFIYHGSTLNVPL